MLALTPDEVAYLVHALNRQADLFRHNGFAVPGGIANFRRALGSNRVTTGHGGPTSRSSSTSGGPAPDGGVTELVSIEEGARMLCISYRTLTRRIEQGDFSTVRIGARRKLRRRDLRAAIDASQED